ncbi:uncharacterized protein BDV14DRAFT_49766 [Aspergillus stella-maris]|uniref:uncharacterized protein n=1 Tax=Aspergillus stella-maris TaxID=1810926 RepID=UPI003CCD993C
MASITSLPIEIFDQICNLLGPKEIYSLRLCCKALALKTYDYFGAQNFGQVYIALTSDGLQFLEDLAGHERLRTYVTELWILPGLFYGKYALTYRDIVCYDEEHPEPKPAATPSFSRRRPPSEYLSQAISCMRSVNPPKMSATSFEWIMGKSRGLQLPSSEKHYRRYQDTVSDHFRVILGSAEDTSDSLHTRLQETLARCLSCLPSLCAVGLRNLFDKSPPYGQGEANRNATGVRKLTRKLVFNPADPGIHLGIFRPGETEFRPGILQSHLFTSLMLAIGTSGAHISTLETGSLMVDDGLPLTSTEEDTLRPFVHHLRSLSLTITSAQGQRVERSRLQSQEAEVAPKLQTYTAWSERKTLDSRLLPFFAEASPNLETLNLSAQPSYIGNLPPREDRSGLDYADAHFTYIAHNFHFTRLSALSLWEISTTVPVFKTFMGSARTTLKELSIEHVRWTNDRYFGQPDRRRDPGLHQARGLEAVHVARQVFAYLREWSGLEHLRVSAWLYQARGLRFREADDERGMECVYDKRRSDISLREWIDQLQIEASRY